MKSHFSNIIMILESIYVNWLMWVSFLLSLINYIFTDNFGFMFWFHLLGIVLFTSTIYSYHILKSIDEWGRPRG